jgi:hypothetical protein
MAFLEEDEEEVTALKPFQVYSEVDYEERIPIVT